MTRFEKLKQMSVEEIAEWWWENVDCSVCPFWSDCRTDNTIALTCADEVKRILNSEVQPEQEVCGSCAINFEED